MGQWTLDQYDNVLRNKVKSLVGGAVKRMKLDKDEEPFISYEAFVEELDVGDSFTATIIDVLVKEVADRRKRPSRHDCRLISERTAKTLRMQASPLHIYRPRQSHRSSTSIRRNVPILTDYPPLPRSDEIGHSEEEDEWNPGHILEGRGISGSDSDDAYLTVTGFRGEHHASVFPRLDSNPREGPTDAVHAHDTAAVTSPRPVSPPVPSFTSSYGSILGTSGSSLNRQNSIHRRARSRTVDFNEFTQRRRSYIRANSSQVSDQSSSENPSDSIWAFHSSGGPSRTDEPRLPPLESSGMLHARRIFPPMRLRREAGGVPIRTPGELDAHIDDMPWSIGARPNYLDPWSDLSSGRADPIVGTDASQTMPRRSGAMDVNGDRQSVVGPRLRRGGIRPPESLFSRFLSEERVRYLGISSPSASDPTTPLPIQGSTTGANVPTLNPGSSGPQTSDFPSSSFFPSHDDTFQLLTPRSVSPSGESLL